MIPLGGLCKHDSRQLKKIYQVIRVVQQEAPPRAHIPTTNLGSLKKKWQ